jgi:hypothetical protein
MIATGCFGWNISHLFDVHDDSMEINLGNATVERQYRVTSAEAGLSICGLTSTFAAAYEIISIFR